MAHLETELEQSRLRETETLGALREMQDKVLDMEKVRRGGCHVGSQPLVSSGRKRRRKDRPSPSQAVPVEEALSPAALEPRTPPWPRAPAPPWQSPHTQPEEGAATLMSHG